MNTSPMSDFQQILRTNLKCSSLNVAPFLVTVQGRITPEEIVVRTDQAAHTSHLTLRYPNGVEEDILVSCGNGETVWHRRTVNRSRETLRLVELGIRLEGIALGEDRTKDYFYHAENPRIYQKMTIPVGIKRSQNSVKDSGFDTLAGTKWADPGVVSDRVGASPYQPFPAVLLSNYGTREGLVHGTLSQRVFFHNYLFSHTDAGVVWDILSSFKSISHLELPPDGVLDDRWYLGRTGQADNVERVFEAYTRVLRQHLPPLRGAGPANRHSIAWGSWNDGIFRDFDQARLFKMADFIRDNLPTVKWMQIDDGYASRCDEYKVAHGLGMPYEGNGCVDPKKFPEGFKAFTDGVKERGVKPAIWIGGYVSGKSPLYKEHPDWFVDYSYRIDDPYVFDVSKPEVRAYMLKALDYFTAQGGFEAIKHDFWSFAFEDSHPLLSGHAASGYQWRSWWCSEIRKRLPDYGYLQTGCDIVMGNPFLAEWFTNYRYGIDIGDGDWGNVVTNFLWGATCFSLHIGDLFVPNSDSIGILESLSDNEVRTLIDYCLISRSLVEVAGWLYKYKDHPRMAWIKKAMCCPNNGQDVFFADWDYRQEDSFGPPIWYLRTPHFSLLEGNPALPIRTVAVFNMRDEDMQFALTPSKLDLPDGDYMVTDVWSLETVDMANFADFTLGGRLSRLLAVSPVTDSMQVLDANIEIKAVHAVGSGLALHFAHAGDLVLVLSRPPRQVSLNSKSVSFETTSAKGNWIVSLRIPPHAVVNVG